MRNPNGYGHVVHLPGNRRKPWACRKTVGYYFNEETGKTSQKFQYLSYHRTRREAERALMEYNADPYLMNNYTLEDIYAMWLETKSNTSEATQRNYSKSFKKLTPLYNKKVRELTKQELQLYLDAEQLTKATAKQLRVLLVALFDYCVKRQLLPESSLNMVRNLDFVPNKASNKIDRKVFTESELSYLWANYEHDDVIRIMLVYIYTGMRFEELQTLKEENCFDDYVRVTKSKTESGLRDVPISDKVKSLLPIPSVGSYSNFRRAFLDVCSAMNCEHTIHDMRHTFITLLTEAEVDARTIKQIVGHKSDDITEGIYTHISMKKMLEAVNRI